ncbi:putative Rad51 family DNA repair protein [Phyllosticta capitalensis]|uniref:uncharacterized protein n=1 Tax=Phyllosticta capitalensis TaxID=121624 RepID=UPI00312EF2B5
MSAEDLGRRLLGEVEEAGLDEILKSVKSLAEPEISSRFGIPPLDSLLGVFEQHAASLAAQRKPPTSPSVERKSKQTQKDSLNTRTPVIELTSLGPGAGKTHLLYLITALAILPEAHGGIEIQGRSSAVIFIDADGRFSVERLVQVMKSHMGQRIQQHNRKTTSNEAGPEVHEVAIDETEQTSIISHALDHVHILQPQSYAALISTLTQLPTYLFDASAHKSFHRPLHSIILDSASAFFHPLKAAEEHASIPQAQYNGPAIASTTIASNTTSEAYAALVRELRSLQRQLHCAVITTTSSLSVSKLDGGNSPFPTLRPLLPPAFTSFATVRLAVTREIVPAFPPAMSVQEALRERAQRQAVVEQGRVRVSVDGWGADGWAREVREGVAGMTDRGAWGMRITKDGVVVGNEERDETEHV